MATPPTSQPSQPPNPPSPPSDPPAPVSTDGALDDAAVVDPDIDMNIDTEEETKIEPGNVDKRPEQPHQPNQPNQPHQPQEEPPEIKLPTQKDISLHDFISKMDDYAPIIPDAVTQHHLLLAGLNPHTTPLPLQRLLALATQKFIADIAADAYQFSRMRSNASSSSAGGVPTAAGGGGGGAGAGAGAGAGLAGGAAAGQGAGASGGGAAGGGAGGGDKGRGAGLATMGMQRAGFGGGGSGGGGQAGRAVLTMEDLGCAVGEYGVNVRRGEFYR